MDVSKVTTGSRRIDGGIYRAPIGTIVPTAADAQLDAVYKNLGYISEDGVTNSISKTSQQIKEWGGDVVKNVNTGQTDIFKLKFIESLNPEVLKTIYGNSNVTVADDGKIAVAVNAKDTGEAIYVIDMIQSGGALKRIVIPRGTITALGDIVYKGDTAVAYDVTISTGLDSGKNTHYEYISPAPTE